MTAEISNDAYKFIPTHHTELSELAFTLDGIVETVEYFPESPFPHVKIVCFTEGQNEFFHCAMNRFETLVYKRTMESASGMDVYKVVPKTRR